MDLSGFALGMPFAFLRDPCASQSSGATNGLANVISINTGLVFSIYRGPKSLQPCQLRHPMAKGVVRPSFTFLALRRMFPGPPILFEAGRLPPAIGVAFLNLS